MESKQVPFDIIKQKIIKTDEILQMYLENNNKLKKAAHVIKELKCRYDRLQLENERNVFSLDSLKSKCERLESHNQELSQQNSSLEQQYNQNLVDSHNHIKNLENELQMLSELKTASETPSSSKNINSKEKKIKHKELEEKLAKYRQAEIEHKLECNRLLKENARLNEKVHKVSEDNIRTFNVVNKEKAKIFQDLQKLQQELDNNINSHGQINYEKDKAVNELNISLSTIDVLKNRISYLENENNDLLKEKSLITSKSRNESCTVSVQTDTYYHSTEEKNCESDIESLTEIFKEMISVAPLSPFRSVTPAHLSCNSPNLPEIVTPSIPLEENINDISDMNTASYIKPQICGNEENIPLQQIKKENKYFKQKIFNNRKNFKKRPLKRKLKPKTQDSVLKALQILKKSKINFTISSESTLPINFNYTNPTSQINVSSESTQIECLGCDTKNCKKVYMLMDEFNKNKSLIGFFNLKKDYVSPPTSRIDNRVCNNPREDSIYAIKPVMSPENVLDRLADLVIEKISNTSKNSYIRKNSYYNAEAEIELEHLFEKPTNETQAINALLMKKLREETLIKENKCYGSEFSSEISLPSYLNNISQTSSVTEVSSKVYQSESEIMPNCSSRSELKNQILKEEENVIPNTLVSHLKETIMPCQEISSKFGDIHEDNFYPIDRCRDLIIEGDENNVFISSQSSETALSSDLEIFTGQEIKKVREKEELLLNEHCENPNGLFTQVKQEKSDLTGSKNQLNDSNINKDKKITILNMEVFKNFIKQEKKPDDSQNIFEVHENPADIITKQSTIFPDIKPYESFTTTKMNSYEDYNIPTIVSTAKTKSFEEIKSNDSNKQKEELTELEKNKRNSRNHSKKQSQREEIIETNQIKTNLNVKTPPEIKLDIKNKFNSLLAKPLNTLISPDTDYCINNFLGNEGTMSHEINSFINIFQSNSFSELNKSPLAETFKSKSARQLFPKSSNNKNGNINIADCLSDIEDASCPRSPDLFENESDCEFVPKIIPLEKIEDMENVLGKETSDMENVLGKETSDMENVLGKEISPTNRKYPTTPIHSLLQKSKSENPFKRKTRCQINKNTRRINISTDSYSSDELEKPYCKSRRLKRNRIKIISSDSEGSTEELVSSQEVTPANEENVTCSVIGKDESYLIKNGIESTPNKSVPIKRRRGRPRKYPKVEIDDKLLTKEDITKKGEGKSTFPKPTKKNTKIQSKIMRQMKEKQIMLQKQPVSNVFSVLSTSIDCDVRLKETIDEKKNIKDGKSIDIGKSKLRNQEITVTHPNNKNVHKNKIKPAKYKGDILSEILGAMDKDKPQEKSIVKKRDIPDVIDDKQWRKNILDIAEVTHQNNNIDMSDIYGQQPYRKKRVGILKIGAKVPGKIALLLKKLLKIKNEDDIPESLMLEFKRFNISDIVDIILYQVSKNISDKPEMKWYPAPLMTRTQRIFLRLLVKLEQEKGFENILEQFYFKTHQYMFKTGGCNRRSAIPLTRLFVGLCRIHGNVNRMRTFICEAFFYIEDTAIPIFFTVLTSWIDIIPMEHSVKNYPLAKVLVQLVHLKTCNRPGYNLFPLKLLLSQYYGYPKERWDCDQLFQELCQDYLSNPSIATDYAIRLFCKNKDTKWVYKKINEFFKPLIYKIPSENANFKAATIILMGKICRQFKSKKTYDHKCSVELMRWFEGLLEDDTCDIIRKSINLSMEYLPKKGKNPTNHYFEGKTSKTVTELTETSDLM